MILIKGDYTEIDKEIDRVSKLPRAKDRKKLDAILTAAYIETQGDVHIRTGSLISSGKKDTTTHGSVWEGSISYGGPSAGINNPVKYAIYEKARGGAHDFMRNVHLTHEQFVSAIEGILAGS